MTDTILVREKITGFIQKAEATSSSNNNNGWAMYNAITIKGKGIGKTNKSGAKEKNII